MTSNHNTPYQNLNPDLILDAIESVGMHCNGSLFALNSYENRVYQVGIEDADPIIVKFYRPGRWTDAAILEEHEFAAELISHEIPVVAPINIEGKTLHNFNEFRFTLFPRRGGHALEVDNMEQLEWMGRFIGRIHAVGAVKPFKHRVTLDVKTFGYQPYEFLKQNNFIPLTIKQQYDTTILALLAQVDEVFQQVKNINFIRLHGDFHAGNVLWRDSGPHIVDLDDCLMGPAIQDIWMMLSGNNREYKNQLNHILFGYEEFFDFDMREVRYIEALRTLRMINYSGWLAKRWEDPAFPLSFPWFNTERYWDEQLLNLREQSQLLLEIQEG